MYEYRRCGNPEYFEVLGPGLNYHGTYPSFPGDDYVAEKLCRLLAKAHGAGAAERAKEIRIALGVHDTPWGVKVG